MKLLIICQIETHNMEAFLMFRTKQIHGRKFKFCDKYYWNTGRQALQSFKKYF